MSIVLRCDGCSKLQSGEPFTEVVAGTGVSINFVNVTPTLHFCSDCIAKPDVVRRAKDANWHVAAGGKVGYNPPGQSGEVAGKFQSS